MQVIGFCRFSYPAMGGFQVGHETLEERIAYLYAPARIEERFALFETFCLPGLKAQTDQDFTFVILVGEAMPEPYLQRLADLVEGWAPAVILPWGPAPHRRACQAAINSVRDHDQICLQFRHDDDDAVAVDFVARLRAAAEGCRGLLEANRMTGFDWSGGYVARADADGLRAEPISRPYWGVAQAIAVRPGVKKTVMNFSHNKLCQNMPMVTFPDPAIYVRGHNGFNDSRQAAHVTQTELPRLDAEGEALFEDRFAIKADAVRRVFGRLGVV